LSKCSSEDQNEGIHMFRVGIDVGGTFTDFLVTDDSGESRIFKSPTTPQNPTEGVFSGLESAAASFGLNLKQFLSQIERIVHGTTITTNATLTGKGAKTGFITTSGFRDILNMRRGLRENQYQSKSSPPAPLVPRRLIGVIRERVDCTGAVITPLNQDDVVACARLFKVEDVEAVAISFLWSFANPEHERRAAQIVREEMGDIYISISSDVLPQIRAYERHSTTVLNAYSGPPLARYLTSLEQRLSKAGFHGVLLIMQSNGGVMSPQLASQFAVNTLLSGPAGGPIAGIHYGSAHDLNNLICCDLGGTSFDVSLVRDGHPALASESSIGGHRLSVPMLDIHTIGAGGGSIAWIDDGGMLRVGPQSAGADPGPACYGKGGDNPTTTDADLLLGYLDPDFFHGGQLKLDVEAAQRAIKTKIADPLGMSIVDAAAGIHRLTNAHMSAAIGVVSLQRGLDPREFGLVVAGGAGPIHALPIAEELGIDTILIPRESSVFCAVGMLLSDLKHDYVRSHPIEVDKLDHSVLHRICQELRQKGTDTLRSEGIAADRTLLSLSADLRYIGQFNEVETPAFPEGSVNSDTVGTMVASFHARHHGMYGYSMAGAPVELINLRLSASGVTEKPRLKELEPGGASPLHAYKAARRAYFDGHFREVSVYDGLKLAPGNIVSGPAIVEQPTTTIILTTGFVMSCDHYGTYVLKPKDATEKRSPNRLASKEAVQ
jgi:N-methylhydantoinase A